jgi:threonine dehydrogenase-like Zn-dependent dehydrogenase
VKAVSYAGAHRMSVTNHPKPKLKTPSDPILRVTTTGICGAICM